MLDLWLIVFPSADFSLSVDMVTKVFKLRWVRAICTEHLLSLHNKGFQTLKFGRADLDWFGRHDGIKAWMYDIFEDLPFLFTAHQRSEQQRPVYMRQISTQCRLDACSEVMPHGNFFGVNVALSWFGWDVSYLSNPVGNVGLESMRVIIDVLQCDAEEWGRNVQISLL